MESTRQTVHDIMSLGRAAHFTRQAGVMDPIQALKNRLARHSELRFTSTATSVFVEPPTDDGFAVSLLSSPNDYVVHFDGWHEHFSTPEKALDCFAFGFSGKARVAITYRGRTPVKWVLEHLNEGEWRADSEVGHFFIPFWLRPRVVYRQNPDLLPTA
jgi:hypothetical protein